MFFVSAHNPNYPVAFCSPAKTMGRRPVGALCCRAAAKAQSQGDFYKLLSVSGGCNASNEEIKRAYRAMALQCHPDLVCDPLLKEQSTKLFVQLNAAYKTLSDPVLRREYDDSIMGFSNTHHHRPRRSPFVVDRAVWQQQILDLKRRSALRRDRSSWAARMRAEKC